MATTGSAIVGLKEETLDQLRELRQVNVDSSKGFEECSEIVKDTGLKRLFENLAEERRTQAKELETQIEWNDQADVEEGSYLAAMHRAWIKVREAVTSDNAGVALNEAERGEDAIKEAYEEAMKQVIGSPIHSLLATQYAAVKKAHDQVRELRDTHNAASS